MVSYDEVRMSNKIKRQALIITSSFYLLLFGLLILGYQENIVDLFPDFIMEWLDVFFQRDTKSIESAPQAFGAL